MTEPTARAIVTALACGRTGCICAQSVRKGRGLTHCAAHSERDPSMNVSERDGRVLVKCHAGCEQSAVLAGLRERKLWPGAAEGAPSEPTPKVKRASRSWDICGADGALLCRHVRTEFHDGSKTFTWELPDGRKGLDGLSPAAMLYGAELLAAAPGKTAVIVEGEKAADALRARGYLALSTVTGAGGTLAAEVLGLLAGRRVILWPDADPGTGRNPYTGQRHMDRVGEALVGLGIETKIVNVSGLPDKADAFDVERPQAVKLLKAAESWPGSWPRPWAGDAVPPPEPEAEVEETDAPARKGGGEKLSQATVLTGLASELIYWRALDSGRAWVSFEIDGHVEHWPVESEQFEGWLTEAYFTHTHGKAPSATGLKDAVRALATRTRLRGEEFATFIRVGQLDGAIYLDLADKAWRAVEITPEGWGIIERPPVRFRRSPGMRPLPDPVTGGSVDELGELLNLEADSDRRLLVAYLLGALFPTGPYPVLNLQGEQGTAKTTTASVVKALVDPAEPDVRSEPGDDRDLAIAADNSWVLAFDNLSRLDMRLSDALCRMSTGGGFATRALYKGREEELFNFVRPVILTGIEDLATRGDLVSRSLYITLPLIPKERRLSMRVFNARFKELRPRVLGALLDALSAALANIEEVDVEIDSRLADFVERVTAAESALDWRPGVFVSDFTGNTEAANAQSLEAYPVAGFIREVASAGGFSGTPSDLLAALDKAADAVDSSLRRQRSWPGNAKRLGGLLHRLAPALRSAGVDVVFARTNGSGSHRIVSVREVVDATSSDVNESVNVAPNSNTKNGSSDVSDVSDVTFPLFGFTKEREEETGGAGDANRTQNGEVNVATSQTSQAISKTATLATTCPACGGSEWLRRRGRAYCRDCGAHIPPSI